MANTNNSSYKPSLFATVHKLGIVDEVEEAIKNGADLDESLMSHLHDDKIPTCTSLTRAIA